MLLLMQRYGTGLACFIAINMEIIFKKKKKNIEFIQCIKLSLRFIIYQLKSQTYETVLI